MPTRAAETSIEIAAPLERVWHTMTALTDYGAWNPFVVKVEQGEATVRIGTALVLDVVWPDGSGKVRSKEIVTVIDPPREDGAGVMRACFSYRYVGVYSTLRLLKAVREQRLERKPDGKTQYTTREEFVGLFAGAVPLANVQAGFEAQARALKARAESLA